MDSTDESTNSFFFRDEKFIKQYRLTIRNIMPYFRLSGFYDKTSVNELLIMQNRPLDQLDKRNGISFYPSFASLRNGRTFDKEELEKPENQVVIIEQGLVIIDKVERLGNEKSTLAKYYILDGSIYQAPDLYSIMSCRIRSAMFHVRESIREVKNMFEWNLQTGYRKKIAADETETPYTFNQSEIKNINVELGDEFKLQTKLLDELLSQIGITKVNQ
ncbi:Mediator of RNA polymerase II transcription subunit 6 [Tritrichomonas musculus]|uniref:Mediator of RNA polymerase II transcription subunit 6 n=1 Tax=Tritrichomonas musculus TaxID=1915356 RepID=A0ABR2KDN7_9EUKA